LEKKDLKETSIRNGVVYKVGDEALKKGIRVGWVIEKSEKYKLLKDFKYKEDFEKLENFTSREVDFITIQTLDEFVAGQHIIFMKGKDEKDYFNSWSNSVRLKTGRLVKSDGVFGYKVQVNQLTGWKEDWLPRGKFISRWSTKRVLMKTENIPQDAQVMPSLGGFTAIEKIKLLTNEIKKGGFYLNSQVEKGKTHLEQKRFCFWDVVLQRYWDITSTDYSPRDRQRTTYHYTKKGGEKKGWGLQLSRISDKNDDSWKNLHVTHVKKNSVAEHEKIIKNDRIIAIEVNDEEKAQTQTYLLKKSNAEEIREYVMNTCSKKNKDKIVSQIIMERIVNKSVSSRISIKPVLDEEHKYSVQLDFSKEFKYKHEKADEKIKEKKIINIWGYIWIYSRSHKKWKYFKVEKNPSLCRMPSNFRCSKPMKKFTNLKKALKEFKKAYTDMEIDDAFKSGYFRDQDGYIYRYIQKDGEHDEEGSSVYLSTNSPYISH